MIMTPPHSESSWDRVTEAFERLLESEDPQSLLVAIEDSELRSEVTLLWQQHLAANSGDFLTQAPNLSSIQAFLPGQLLSHRFKVLRFLGAGGMGQVFLATDERLGGVVAIKSIAPILAPLAHVRRRFVAEVQNARRVTHRNICRIYDYFEDGESVFFAMEFLEGSNLDQLLAAPLTSQQANSWLLQLAHGLQAAHYEGILHGDFKPGNVIVTGGDDARAVITEFCFARTLDAPINPSG